MRLVAGQEHGYRVDKKTIGQMMMFLLEVHGVIFENAERCDLCQVWLSLASRSSLSRRPTIDVGG